MGETPLAALIVTDDAPAPRVLGLDWVDYQLRRAIALGAGHVVILARRAGSAEVAAVDRAHRLGVSATLVRTPAEAADRIHPDEAVLLVSGSHDIALTEIAALARWPGSAVLCVPVASGDDYELIDAQARWSGFARLDGGLVRRTAAVPERSGDWSFASMLLRAAVAQRAERCFVNREPVPASPLSRDGVFDRLVAAPMATQVVRLAQARLPLIAQVAPAVALSAAVLAVCLSVFASVGWAAGPALVALLVARIGSVAREAVFDHGRVNGLMLRGVEPLALATLPVAAIAGQSGTALALAGALIAVRLLLARLRSPRPAWAADSGSAILLTAAGSLAGPGGVVAGLTLAALHAFATLGWAQDRLSGTLTTTD